MARIWTETQLNAIETRGSDLLISAGAGSGKTAVLTERIIQRLTNDAGTDITRMLIVTFTKAAAGELRERISGALSEALAADVGNKHLERQLLRLDSAKICTIHSFCLDILRENFTAAGLSADFRIADDAEMRLLSRELMSELIEDCYNGKISDFESLADTLTGTKGDDSLEDIFLGLYSDLSSYREGLGFITDFAAELESDSRNDFAKSRCGRELFSLIADSTRGYLDCFTDIIPWLDGDEKLSKAYSPAFGYDENFLRGLQALCKNGSYSDLREHINGYNPPRLGTVRGELDEDVTNAKNQRTEFKKKLADIDEKFFSLTPEKIAENQLATAKMLRKLYEVLSNFDERFTKEKRRRMIVDFNDLERMAYSILVENNSPTKLARSISERFDEIFIDEYQDVNSLQDAIFSAISDQNRFMVGDVKQSIYGFRGAEPGIFESYREEFKDGIGKTIFLSNNFRCDKNVIDFTNLVSNAIFPNATGALPYYPEDDLVHSKLGEEPDTPVKIAIFEKPEEDDTREAEFVAAEILELMNNATKNDGTKLKFSDFAILFRSAADRADEFREVFERFGIPLYNNTGGDFFENAEVLLALCLLNVIDDPNRDIYLAGLLKSPLFGFTLDELTLIRRADETGSLFDALKLYTLKNSFEKGEKFLGTLYKYQQKAEELPVDRLIWYLYSDTDLPALVFGSDENGNLRRANLTLLYEYARRFESSSFKGLYNFLRYINDILNEKAKLEPAKVFSESSDTVKFMTIHQSKGLEFPVVFLCGCGKKFNETDLRQNIVAQRGLGIALKLPDSTGFARFDTPVRQAIVKKLGDSQLEEEMRILYVATTRARERLYVTAEVSEREKFLEKCESDAKRLSRSVVMQNGGYIRWIMTAFYSGKLRKKASPCELLLPEPTETEIPRKKSTEKAPESDISLEKIVRERFDFVYPNEFLTKLPAKLSVSELFPTVLDAEATPLEPDELPEITAKVPLFMQDSPTDHASPAERGTATHCFMQFCDFERFREQKNLTALIADECERLGNEKFLSPRAASLVDQYQLKKFFASETFKEICDSSRVCREHRFNVKLPASDFTADEILKNQLSGEFILVQGVIDCFFENSDGSFTLVDYKTDYIPRELSPEDAEKMLIERHKLQLSYYSKALKLITKKPVKRTMIYSFGLGRAIEL